MDVDTFRRDTRAALDDVRRARERFVVLPDGAPFSEAVLAFDRIRWPFARVAGRVQLFSSVHPDVRMREAAEELEREIAQLETELSLDREAFDRLSTLDPRDAADPLDRRLLERARRDFRRSGVDRDEPTRARIRELTEELVEIGQRFDRNILSDTRSIRIEDGAAGLAGLPADYVAAHTPAEDGSVVVTTDPPDLIPFMTYAERDDLRKRLLVENQNRAWPANDGVLRDLVARRHELAGLLGYESWAAYVTEDKMVETPAHAREFIARVLERAREPMRRELAEHLAELRELDPAADALRDWQRAFLTERLKAKRFGFDSQEVRAYFPYERVKDGVLRTTERLYGVELRRVNAAERWHPSVETYELVDRGVVRGRFHLDMHPREGKYKHAALFHVADGIGDHLLPEACLVCNFPAPGNGDPALLLHSQVTTFFHEFGHLLHFLFGGCQRFLRFTGIATEWDFVEVPSQLFEEWAWDPGVLASFARHHETGAPIPADLVTRMRQAEEYGKGLQVVMQMFFASLSLELYERDPDGLDPTRLLVDLKESLTPIPYTEGTHFHAAFGHLHGYSATYYTYMWSLVIAKDLFGCFEGEPMDPVVARRYREEVLARGGTRDAADLVRAFLGRDYGFERWERWLNR